MKTTYQQREQFVDSLIASNLLDLAIDWIGDTLTPEDVFCRQDLETWAYENGFKRFE